MPKEHIYQLTGIRFFLTLIVVLSNMALFGDVDPGFIKDSEWKIFSILSNAPVRVDIFFMLTGFLLFYIYHKEFTGQITSKNYIKFFTVRIARIYPVHILVLLIIGGLYLSGIWQSGGYGSIKRITDDGSWFLNLTLLNAWGIGEYKASWNGPSWSISIELFNYLVFPIIVLLLSEIKKFWFQLTLFLGVLAFYEYLQWAVIKDIGVHNGSAAIIRGLIGLTLGILLAQIYLSKKLEHLPWDYIFIIVIGAFIAMMVLKTQYDLKIDYLFYIPLPFLVLSVASSQKFIKKLFSLPFLIYLGNLSFCIYMTHQPVCRIFKYVLNDYYSSLNNNFIIGVNLLAILCVMVVLSAFIYTYVETPIRCKIKSMMKPIK